MSGPLTTEPLSGSPEALWETGRLRLKQCRFGPMLYNVNDSHVGRLLDRYGEYCLGEVDLFGHFVRPGDIVVDAGANLGAHTVPLAKMVGATGTVHAFEPQPHTWRLLNANMLLNDLDWVKCWNCGLGAKAETLPLGRADPDAENSFNYNFVQPFEDSLDAPVMPLDELDLPQCRLIKADVEGMEASLLAGARATIKRCHPILVLEGEVQPTIPPVLEFLKELGYGAYWHNALYVREENFFGREVEAKWRGIGSSSIVGMPPGWTLHGAIKVKSIDWMQDHGLQR